MADELTPPPPPPGTEHKGKHAPPAASAPPAAGLVGRRVSFQAVDPLTGARYTGDGLVLVDGGDGGVVTVAPLSPFTVDVPADAVSEV